MSTVQALEPGSRHDLRVGLSPDAPNEDQVKDQEGKKHDLIVLRYDVAALGVSLGAL